MDKLTKGKSPERFNGKLKDISIPTIIEYIRFSCIVHIKKGNQIAALFFDNGKLFDVRLNDRTDISIIKEVEKWKDGTFSFCEWDTNIETQAEFIPDILYLAEKLQNDCTLHLKSPNHTGELHINKGITTHVIFDNLTDEKALIQFINESEGIVKMIKGKQKKGKLNLKFNDIKKKYIQTIKKEKPMNVKKLNQSLEILKEDLGEALIASAVWTSSDGQSIVAINPNPKASALLNRVSHNITKTLTDAGFPGLNDYLLLDLNEGTMVLIMIFKDYQWGVMVNREKIQLGLLLNVAMPNAREAFLEALK